MRVHSYDAFKYREVFKITERACGAIRRTERTGKYIRVEDEPHLPVDFMTASVSTELLRNPDFDIEVVEPSVFGPKFTS